MADTCLQPGLVGEMMRNALKIEPSSTGILATMNGMMSSTMRKGRRIFLHLDFEPNNYMAVGLVTVV